MTVSGLDARRVLHWVLAASLLTMLGLNLPGHLSYDSVAALHEGRSGARETWGPILYSALLGRFDRLIPGGALYVVASGALLFGMLASMTALRPRVGWLAPVVAVCLALTPQMLIYQGIVWKDVGFANAAVAGMLLLAHAARRWRQRRPRWTFLLGALLLLALATQIRQNGVVVAVMAALALGWIAAGGRWRRGLVWALGGLCAVMLTGTLASRLAMPQDAPAEGLGAGLQIVQNYDLVGAVTLDRTYRLETFAEADPEGEALLRQRAPLTYTGRRVDFLDTDPVLARIVGTMPPDIRAAEWKALILHDPGLYLRVRWEDFRWLAAPPVVDWCLPLSVGVAAVAPQKMHDLGLTPRQAGSDRELVNYATWFFDTPVYEHLVYAGLSLVLAGLFLWRRDTADIVMAALQLAGVGFMASFFIISIACDYRYLYFTDLAAIAGVIYAAIDPPWRRRPARPA